MRTTEKYDSAILGLNNLYIIDYEGNYYAISEAIIAPDKTICTGRTYLLIDCSQSKAGQRLMSRT